MPSRYCAKTEGTAQAETVQGPKGIRVMCRLYGSPPLLPASQQEWPITAIDIESNQIIASVLETMLVDCYNVIELCRKFQCPESVIWWFRVL